jgi:hypothetical protein
MISICQAFSKLFQAFAKHFPIVGNPLAGKMSTTKVLVDKKEKAKLHVAIKKLRTIRLNERMTYALKLEKEAECNVVKLQEKIKNIPKLSLNACQINHKVFIINFFANGNGQAE